MTTTQHPGTTALLRFFDHDHLPVGVPRDTSEACGDLARVMAEALPDSAEKTAGLRKLLEAKDCFVRAAIPPAPDLPVGPA